jgi:hypothetical protein
MLPLHEQIRFESWRRTVKSATANDLENLKQYTLHIIQYAETHRGMLLQQMDPRGRDHRTNAE